MTYENIITAVDRSIEELCREFWSRPTLHAFTVQRVQ
jgi:hypothetical protein